MRVRTFFILLAGLSLFGFVLFQEAESHTVFQDSTDQRMKRNVAHSDSSGKEMVLEVIEIKGKVEKPGVIIIPKRVEPNLEEVELERSYQQEVKEGIGEIPQPEDALRRVENVESIKKTVERKRK